MMQRWGKLISTVVLNISWKVSFPHCQITNEDGN
jgi:hypothetical protein